MYSDGSDSEDEDDAHLSAYEKERNQRITENNEFLASLNITKPKVT